VRRGVWGTVGEGGDVRGGEMEEGIGMCEGKLGKEVPVL